MPEACLGSQGLLLYSPGIGSSLVLVCLCEETEEPVSQEESVNKTSESASQLPWIQIMNCCLWLKFLNYIHMTGVRVSFMGG